VPRDDKWEKRRKEIISESKVAVGVRFAHKGAPKQIIVPPTGEVTIKGLEPEDEWWMFKIVPGSWSQMEDVK